MINVRSILALFLVSCATACGGARYINCNTTLPAPVDLSCTSDDNCSDAGKIPDDQCVAAAKCVSGQCVYTKDTNHLPDCPCLPGEMRSCGTTTNKGVQICINGSDGNPEWGTCKSCSSCSS